MLIINANIKTMEDVDYPDGYIYIEDGKIYKMGNMKDLDLSISQIDEVIDAENNIVMPGLIDSHCHLGMWEDGLGFEGDDGNEDTDPITPQLRAIDAINPRDRCFQEAISFGITTVVTGPGSSNPIAGTWAAIKTYGHRIDDMIIKDPVGMKFALGENPKNTYNTKNISPVTRMATAALIREQLKKTDDMIIKDPVGMKFALGENPKNTYNTKNISPVTRMATAALIREQLKKTSEYIHNKFRAETEIDYEVPEYDIKCEALEPVLKGDLIAFFHAHRVDDIFTAIRIANEFKLNYVLIHATEAYIIAEDLAMEGARVITGPLICDRSKPELRELTPKNTAILAAKGVSTAICTDHPVIPIQYLGIETNIALKEGLDFDNAIKNITIYAAKICGIDDRVGSLKVGKDADITIFKEYPVLGYNKPECVIVNGVKVI